MFASPSAAAAPRDLHAASTLAAAGHEVHLFLPGRDGISRRGRLRLHRVALPRRLPWLTFPWAYAVLRRLQKGALPPFDIIDAAGGGTPLYYWLLQRKAAGRSPSAPVVAGVESVPPAPRPSFARHAENYCLWAADGVRAPDGRALEVLRRAGALADGVPTALVRDAADRASFYRRVLSRWTPRLPVLPACFPFRDRPPARPGHRPQAADRKKPGTISVVIPCHDLGRYLDQAVRSALRSSRLPRELVIVDDGSTDAVTRGKLQAWESRPGVRVLRTRNQGLAAARNAGAAATSGDYLVFLDADDLLHADYLEKAGRALDANPEVGFVTPWIRRFGEDSRSWAPPLFEFPLALHQNLAGTGSMVRREAFRQAGGFKERLRVCYEDWEFWISVAEMGWAGLPLAGPPLFRYRVRRDSMLNSLSRAAKREAVAEIHRLHPRLLRRYRGPLAATRAEAACRPLLAEKLK